MHARNRWLAPGHGRWLQADPNASALVLIGAGAHSGRELTALVVSLDLSSLTGDGVNVYGYLGGNPMRRWDALGLSWDPFDAVDEYLATDAAQKGNFLSGILDGVHAVAAVAATLMSYLPIPGAAFIGDLALAILNGEDFATALTSAVSGLLPTSKLAMIGLSIAGAIDDLRNPEEIDDTPDDIGELLAAIEQLENGGPANVAALRVRLRGEGHHAISRPIQRALEKNAKTRGKFDRSDPGLITTARAPADHKGYQKWHRDVDNRVVKWIDERLPTPEQFKAYLKGIYRSKAMKSRFPDGIRFPKKPGGRR